MTVVRLTPQRPVCTPAKMSTCPFPRCWSQILGGPLWCPLCGPCPVLCSGSRGRVATPAARRCRVKLHFRRREAGQESGLISWAREWPSCPAAWLPPPTGLQPVCTALPSLDHPASPGRIRHPCWLERRAIRSWPRKANLLSCPQTGIGIELRNPIIWVYEVLPLAQMVYSCVRAIPRLCFSLSWLHRTEKTKAVLLH